MPAEQWPTEAVATAAVDAVAKKFYDQKGYDAPWEDADPLVKLRLRESILPLVWDVIAALPDPRHGAWEEGYSVAYRSAFDDVWDGPEHTNPYPAP